MSIESRVVKYANLFGDWQVEKHLGGGSGGKSAVFSLYRDNNGWREYSALKVISLMEERGRREELPEFRKREYATAVREQREYADQEVRLMDQLRGKTNIVDYQDHRFCNWEDETGFGVDLLIRMEMLTDLRSQLQKGRLFTEQEILRVGRDICQALVICHGKNILHRDIKPENIFFNQDGDYKLGDFGISRLLDVSTFMASTGIGTPQYVAPEQTSGRYDDRVDIYSLGLVLYELSNYNRLPFASTGYVRDVEVQKRMQGIPLPRPEAVSDALTRVILRACAFRPEDRYQSAGEFLQALNALGSGSAPVVNRNSRYSTAPANGQSQNYGTALADTRGQNYGTVPADTRDQNYGTVPADTRDQNYGTVPADTQGQNYGTVPADSRGQSYGTIPADQNAGFRQSYTEENGHSGGTEISRQKKKRKGVILPLLLAALALAAAIFAFALEGQEKPEPEKSDRETETVSRTEPEMNTMPLQTEAPEDACYTSGHQWRSATCEEPETCRHCGESRGIALGHNWIEATYTAPKTCARCAATEGEPLSEPKADPVYLMYLEPVSVVDTLYINKTELEPGDSEIDYAQVKQKIVVDTSGNWYTYSIHPDGSGPEEKSVTYYLGGKYNTFSGYVAFLAFADNVKENKPIEIYCDGKLMAKFVMSSDSEPEYFSIPVAGVQKLKIVYPESLGSNDQAAICDGRLE